MRCGNGIYKIPYKQTYRKVSLTAIPRRQKTCRGDGAEQAPRTSARLLSLIACVCVCVQVTGMLGENLVLPDTITQVGAWRAFIDAFATRYHRNMPATLLLVDCQLSIEHQGAQAAQAPIFDRRCTCVPAPEPRSSYRAPGAVPPAACAVSADPTPQHHPRCDPPVRRTCGASSRSTAQPSRSVFQPF